MPAKPNFKFAQIEAYKLLLQQRQPHLGEPAEKIFIPDKKLIFDSLQNYAINTGLSNSDVSCNGKIRYGCQVQLNKHTHLILHNADISLHNCINWTKLHEIGHIVLGHTEDDKNEEIETNFFAACYLIPNPIIYYFDYLSIEVDTAFIQKYFNVSYEAANRKIETLNKFCFESEFDKQIIMLFMDDILKIQRELNSMKSYNYAF